MTLNGLIDALRNGIQEGITVRDEQSKHADVARQRASVTQEHFSQFMESWQSPDPTPAMGRKQIFRDLQSKWDTHSREEEMDASAQLSIRWVQTFCDIDDALMRLYAYPECHDRAVRIAAIVREIRLIAVERIKEKAPHFAAATEPTSESHEIADINSDRAAQVKRFVQFKASMDVYHTRVQELYRQMDQRTGNLLQEARHIAEQLAASMPSTIDS